MFYDELPKLAEDWILSPPFQTNLDRVSRHLISNGVVDLQPRSSEQLGLVKRRCRRPCSALVCNSWQVLKNLNATPSGYSCNILGLALHKTTYYLCFFYRSRSNSAQDSCFPGRSMLLLTLLFRLGSSSQVWCNLSILVHRCWPSPSRRSRKWSFFRSYRTNYVTFEGMS